MDRRRFLLTSLAGVVAAPLAAGAQQAGRVYRLGWLAQSEPKTPEIIRIYDAVLQGLRDHGWVEGQNIVIERRYAVGREEKNAARARLPPARSTATTGPV